jgi:adenine phosphoribosyltransferase
MYSVEAIEKKLRQIPDFPKPGINFLDMSPVLAEPGMFKSLIHHLCQPYAGKKINKIVAMESRGFILGAAMAEHLNSGFVMVRKKGKLPGPTLSVSYTLEYGTDQLEILPQSIEPQEPILIVDDVLATGGTAQATFALCEKLKAQVVGFSFFMEISFLEGRTKLQAPVHSLLIK